jgi:hypothetical protein
LDNDGQKGDVQKKPKHHFIEVVIKDGYAQEFVHCMVILLIFLNLRLNIFCFKDGSFSAIPMQYLLTRIG